MWTRVVVLFAAAATCCLAADKANDQVTYLPGLDENGLPQPLFPHYAGYLNATNGRRFFYWFVESESKPQQDPVVLWLNGGPGCSSMTGFLSENGPWRSHPNGTLTNFEWNWNKEASLIFMDSPQCVGYSYTDEGACISNDDTTAYDNYIALKDFFAAFPDFVHQEFYIFGESYAGVYVPTLSALVVDDPEINFIGMGIGNGVNDNLMMDSGAVEFMWARGTFGSQLYYDLVDACCPGNNATRCMFAGNDDAQCRLLYGRVANLMWNSGLNPYDMYAQCYPNALRSTFGNKMGGIIRETEDEIVVSIPEGIPMTNEERLEYQEYLDELRATGKTIHSGIPCTDTSDRENYLNRADVREALHVDPSIGPWVACSDTLMYSKQYETVKAEYLKVLDAGRRVLSYYGDTDIACNHLGSLWFYDDLDQPELEGYKDWMYNATDGSTQIAGYVQQWQNLIYLTVKGSGHMVPTDTPKRGYILFDKFLKDQPY